MMKRKILVVEDDTNLARALGVRLETAGFEVFHAVDGVEALKLAVHHHPDLVIMDIWVPQGNGILIAQRMKHVGLADIPVIFLTAGKKEQLWKIAEETEPAGFFEKPYDSKQLLASIAAALEMPRACAARANRPTGLP
jgi:DNA-binding response OmpR family regulator